MGTRPDAISPSGIASENWDAIDVDKFRDEDEAVAALLAALRLRREDRGVIGGIAVALVKGARARAERQGVMESFLREFSLSTAEGLALMGLAEALLRTPDSETQNRLIAERVGPADWQAHLGNSESLFVNASTWALMLTGKWGVMEEPDRAGAFRRLAVRLGEPLLRQAVGQAIRIMGRQFVLGTDIGSALDRARKEELLCSFDMLGEGARTLADAERYEAAYAEAIAALAAAAPAGGPETAHGISVKLSALSPRYEPTQEARVWDGLYPRLLRLARLAAAANINLTLDAEEADRLVLSLRLLDRLAREPSLKGWDGLGLAVQAYQKRAAEVIAGVAALARQTGRRLMLRLVKGAYWDSEIKRSQIAGRPDYPVFTTKAATDISYLVCAEAVLAAHPHLYGQFATHNAHTLAAVHHMAKAAGVGIEFQRLHGMGEALYDAAREMFGPISVRTYAPVGAYRDLLPYLVRRLLENGANSSFVHQLLDIATPPEKAIDDPLCRLPAAPPYRHPRIPTPVDLYGDRRNSLGIDLGQAAARAGLDAALEKLDRQRLEGHPIIGGVAIAGPAPRAVVLPFDPSHRVGLTSESGADQIARAFALAKEAQLGWDAKGGAARAVLLRAMADALEANMAMLAALCVREAGKTWPDAIAEVREAADFCRFYALLAERQFGVDEKLKGPAGETNSLALHGRGVFVCISPWNFPLAIFTGQVAAALAAGNAVLAKPAEQTPLIAGEAVRLFHAAGLDPRLLHLLPGRGETVGAALVAHPAADGVAFTGGTPTARAINLAMAQRDGPIIPFIAETGGLNAMFVDTTALREQVIDDVILSAFGSAGQRCSALRILFLPEETADELIAGLSGAMDVLSLGDPAAFATDIGPVIDSEARSSLEEALSRLEKGGRLLKRVPQAVSAPLLFAPAMVEIALEQLPDREIFGPILHLVRYRGGQLETACCALAAKRYGLTLGIHSRLDSFTRRVRALVPAGNSYVNRSIIGAVVGVQPFGGEGLSGTGPKAGGPNALGRYAVERALSVNIAAQGGDPALLNL
jgi:RHH-type proline utilization regulon transcriptional repressor/proline dehydrogenase/delta 1-pyrroline-5-carboxylate dehydrogenase